MHIRLYQILATVLLLGVAGCASQKGPSLSTWGMDETKVFTLRPGADRERNFGSVGVTGIDLRIYPGMVLKVEKVTPGSPADGHIQPGEVIQAVNGVNFTGKNPFVVLGNALTHAEATTGQLHFDVVPVEGGAVKQVTITIPVLGAYSDTWPLDCAKSQAIIAQAAKFYAKTMRYPSDSYNEPLEQYQTHGIGGALACLFLLSTGDDQYLPRVKAYVDELGKDVSAIGESTWNNGYNGILCAEYYLRTGDPAAMPIIQHYCDNAKERQNYGVGWGHGGRNINPGYTSSGLVNAAGTQVLTSLLLAKECGAKVDDKVLLGALQYWYRFAGHGSATYGDHRAQGHFGSNGKDGMAATAMKAATLAQGDISDYQAALNSFSSAMFTSYARMITGHGDNGRGDAIWRGLSAAYMLDVAPDAYHEVMNNLTWFYDLSRRPGGGLGVASNKRFDDLGSGAGVALTYTAPLKTLRITGAPPSPYAKPFNLPKRIWGREADLAFLSLEHCKGFVKDGTPIHEIYYRLGAQFDKRRKERDTKALPREDIDQGLYHQRYLFRVQAAKLLCRSGDFATIERLLRDEDPRLRRAALDGLIDYQIWNNIGREAVAPEQMSPTMIEAFRNIISDPDEAWYVIDGALTAFNRAPADAIIEALPLIKPYATHEEWWLRQGAFLAMAGTIDDEQALKTVLPTMLEMMVKETRPMIRETIRDTVGAIMKQYRNDSAVNGMIVAALKRMVATRQIIPGATSIEGGYDVANAAQDCLKYDPEQALTIAKLVEGRIPDLQNRSLGSVVQELVQQAEKPGRDQLKSILLNAYLPEYVRRLKKGNPDLGRHLTLINLKGDDVDWEILGKVSPMNRTWRFTTFDPNPEDALPMREKKRFRDVAIPAELSGWFKPEFDDSKWTTGKAPIGVGIFTGKRGKEKEPIPNQSDWGDKEFLLMRGQFEIPDTNYDFYRLRVLTKQGYHIYLNGTLIRTYIWWKDGPSYRAIGMSPDMTKHLRKGINTLAVYANTAYEKGKPVAQIDVSIEGLRLGDLEK